MVAVGGDGTVHEVVNGMVDAGAPEKSDVALAVVAAGSGCDFIRTFGIPADVVAACAVALGRTARSVDLVAMHTGNAAAQRHFCNIAEVGLGGENIHRAVDLPRWLGGSRYLVSFWLTLAAYRPVQAKVTVDGRLAHDGRAVNIVVANAAYFGGGMHISPRSDPGDGKIDVLVFHGPKSDAFTLVPRIYRGTHLPHPNVLELRGANVRVESTPAVEVEADGEAAGSTPVSFTVLPGAIRLKVPLAATTSAALP